MKIAFIFADYSHKKFEEDIDVVSREFGIFPPLGLGYASAIARRAGHDSMIIDAHALKLSPRRTLNELNKFNPDLLGFMLTSYMFHDTYRYIAYLKEQTGLPVLVGNVNMELYPAETMSYAAIDYGLIGSAVETLPVLLESIEARRPPPDMPGICYKRDGRVVVNRPRTLKENFAKLPFPDRDGLPHHLYHAVMSKRRNVTALITARGCPSACNFCHIHNTPYSARSPRGVIEEIIRCHDDYGIREFEIFDPTFTIDRERVIEICKLIIDRDLDINFACRTRVDRVDPELLQYMYRAGCTRILYGVESGSQQMLDKARKNIDLNLTRNAIVMTQDAGIKALGFFLIGAVGETMETVKATIKFASEINVDYAQFHKTMPKPRTELAKMAEEHLGYDYWRSYILGEAPEMRLPSPWTELSEKEIERLAIKAYRNFYYRPAFIYRALKELSSPAELFGYIRSAIGLFRVRSDLND